MNAYQCDVIQWDIGDSRQTGCVVKFAIHTTEEVVKTVIY